MTTAKYRARQILKFAITMTAKLSRFATERLLDFLAVMNIGTSTTNLMIMNVNTLVEYKWNISGI